MITISVFPQTFTKIIVIRTEWSLHVKRLSPPSCTRLAPTEGSPTSTPTSAWPPPAWSRTRGSSRRSPGWLMICSKLLKTRDLQGRGGDLPQRLWLSHSSPTPCPASERIHARLHPLLLNQVNFEKKELKCDISFLRPFGATAMLGSWSKEAGAQLYCVEPSGTGYGEESRWEIKIQTCNSRLLGLRCWQGQVRRQDGVGEDQDDGDDLRRAHQGGRKDHLPGRSFGLHFGSGININL